VTTPRRRLVRPKPAAVPDEAARQRRLKQLQQRLQTEQVTLARWMRRLKRAFHAVESGQRKIARMQGQLARLEEGPQNASAPETGGKRPQRRPAP
jgi:predicted  nucleic acid-binding Zn-ribbon protein